MCPQKILVTRPDFNAGAVKRLKERYEVECHSVLENFTREDFLKAVKGKDAIICRYVNRIDKEVLDAAGPQLKVVVTLTRGYNNIDLEECRKRSVVVCNSPTSASSGAVAEVAVWLMLSAARNLIRAHLAIERGHWTIMGHLDNYGRSLRESVVGIVGLGSIGYEVLKRIIPFGVSQVYYTNLRSRNLKGEELGARPLPFKELLAKSDFVVVTCSLTPESRRLFDTKAFSLMKRSAIFVNVSRGEVVDQEALYDALKNCQIKAAALDAMYPEPLPKDHKLISLPNIILSPHCSGLEYNAMEEAGELAARNVEAVLEGKDPITPV